MRAPSYDRGMDSPRPLHWDGHRLHVLDQTRLPHEETVLTLTGARDTAEAIKRLAVRGAPLIGVAAGYGLAMEVSDHPDLAALEEGAEILRTARPTAVNLMWAVDRVKNAALQTGPVRMAGAARAEAEAIEREDIAASKAVARHGADVLDAALGTREGPVRVMTHCNS